MSKSLCTSAVHLPAIGTPQHSTGENNPWPVPRGNAREKYPKELEGRFQTVKTIFHEKQ